MAVSTGDDAAAVKLAEAVGLDPSRTMGFTICVYPDSLITVHGTQTADAKVIEDVTRVFLNASSFRPVDETRAIPVNRQRDLSARAHRGLLTKAESLALAVLKGGPDGENAIGPMIDACLEDFGHGSYRVPVRIIGDKKRMRLIITPPDGQRLGAAMAEQMIDLAHRWIDGVGQCLLLPGGWSAEVIEVGEGAEAGVAIQQ